MGDMAQTQQKRKDQLREPPFTREAVDAQEARKVKSEYRSAGTTQFKIVPFLV